MSAPTNHPVDSQTGLLTILVRFLWMFLGTFTLMICAAAIFMGESTSTKVPDTIFWCVVPSMIIVRFLDIKFLNGQTVTGQPAAFSHWRRYAVLLIIIAAIIWAAAHSVAYLSK